MRLPYVVDVTVHNSYKDFSCNIEDRISMAFQMEKRMKTEDQVGLKVLQNNNLRRYQADIYCEVFAESSPYAHS